MRVGFNPHKDKPLEKSHYIHQVIVPVYIPHAEGYFKDSFTVLQHCLNSLIQSVHSKTMITVVNNGSSKEVVHYLNQLFEAQKIQELIHTENLGKINAILKGVTGNNIELVTISDADVLFLKDWQKETVSVFNHFPQAGVVGIVPQIRMFEYFSGNLIFDHWFSSNLKFTPLQNPEAFKKFYYSIGWGEDYNPDYLKWTLTLDQNKARAVVGSGHFVATYKKELFGEIKTYLGFKLGADTERYLDEKPLSKGLWRLTTVDNYAYHMGNVAEDWMAETIQNNAVAEVPVVTLQPSSRSYVPNTFSFFIKNRLFTKLFDKKWVRRYFYKAKGLPKEVAQNY
ncbi:glycosyltransferase family A protein [Flavobacterium sedimenticola]|uniref:Glycosyltransferase family A protein n=1 Tax=Flavobacterium sedimenticola TaxID=3043286 RepID=A0ABT6XRG9_9FLAO|nr:glycosyltransferase family A protein [Flavobacterium sedimenticola]MDI9257675.1 glycosyltransferase family A protein [Flavobacterium sedimenticola]